MKKTILVVLAGVLALGLAGQAYAANLLGNSGFESGALEPWTEAGHPQTEITTEQRHGGTYSAARYVDEFDEGEAFWSAIVQEKPVSAGQPVYGRIYIKTGFNPLATARAGIVFSFLNADGDDIPNADVKSYRSIGGQQTGWRQVEIATRAAPAGAVNVAFKAYLFAENGDTLSQTGKVYYDTAYMDNVYRSPAIQTSLLNRGFENGANDWFVPIYGTVPGIPFYGTVAVKRTGLYAGYSQVQRLSSDFYATVYQDVACAAGKKVEARVWVQTEFLATSKSAAGMMVDFIGASNNIIKRYNKNLKTTTTWTLVRPVLNVIATTGTTKVRVSLYAYNPVSGSGSSVGKKAYFDDAHLAITTP